MNLHQIFSPQTPPTPTQLQQSRRVVTCEGAIAAVIYSLGTGNFLAGYLSQLGASVSFCAIVAMIPQLGCVIQLAAPFLFERLKYRKFAIWLSCVLFRFSLGFVMVLPAFFGESKSVLPIVLALYSFAFLMAGFVTPALQKMTLDISPQEHRGSFFARKDIIATCVNGVATLVVGRLLDYFVGSGNPAMGYVIIGVISLCAAALDTVALGSIHEFQAPYVNKMRLADLLQPLYDVSYRPILRYMVVGGFAGGLSSSFLSIYLLRGLSLSHTFITSVGMVSALAGMIGTWGWGRYSDKVSWKKMIQRSSLLTTLCTMGWFFVWPAQAPVFAPVLLVVTAASVGGAAIANMNLQYVCSPPAAKTTYISVTSALASIVAVGAAALSTTVQPMLENLVGERSIAWLFLVSAVGSLINWFINASRLPERK